MRVLQSKDDAGLAAKVNLLRWMVIPNENQVSNPLIKIATPQSSASGAEC
jgi:hypothetical protein